MSHSGGILASWQQYDITVPRAGGNPPGYGGAGWPGYEDDNDFSDPSCIAAWLFETGALNIDSKGSNDWSIDNGAPTADTGDYIQGVSSIFFDNSPSSDMYEILDTNLDAGFPGKFGTSNTEITVCFWVKLLAISPSYKQVACLYKTASGQKSFLITISGTPSDWSLHFDLSSNGTSITQLNVHSSVLDINKWYHVSCSVGGGNVRIRIFDNNAEAILGTDLTNTHTMAVCSGRLRMYGGASDYDNQVLFDEMIVFDTALSVEDIDKVRTGNYI